MYKILPILLSVLSGAWCRFEITQDYYDFFTTASSTNDQESLTTVATNKTCEREDGAVGKCVHQYRCNDTDVSSELIDARVPVSSCPEPLKCCLNQIKPSQKPALAAGCGWANPKGVDVPTELISKNNGDHAVFGEYPWVCAVLQKRDAADAQTPQYRGGGSLIHPSVVLTAAHLLVSKEVLTAEQLLIRAGEYDSQTEEELYPHQDRDVTALEVHKDYNKKTLFYDIALLFLAQPVELAPNVGVTCLPPPPSHPTQLGSNNRCVASGWGKDVFGKEGRYAVTLKKVEVPIVERGQCQKDLQKTRLGSKFILHNTFLCAGGQEGKDTCIGDGGSPLACPLEETDRYVQAGIVAWGIGCHTQVPAAYVDVANQRDWIDDKVLGKGYDPKIYTY